MLLPAPSKLSTSGSSASGSSIKFSKVRDDLNIRLFRGFMRLEDETGRIIPTNTASLEVDFAELERRGFSIKAGSMVMYDRKIDGFRLLTDDEYPTEILSQAGSFIYAVPFLMLFRMSPFPRLTYMLTSINESRAVITSAGDVVTSDSFAINTFAVQRSSIVSNVYNVSVSVNINLSTTLLRASCILRMKFLDDSNRLLGMMEGRHQNNTNTYSFDLVTEDTFDQNGEMIFKRSLYTSIS